MPRSSSTVYILTLLLGAAFLWLWNYGLWDLEGPDEGRYVQIAKELLGRSNWLILTVNGEPYEQKPPLPFWMFAASMKLGGGEVSAWTVRLPSVLAGILTVLLVFDIGRVRWNPRAGFLAGLCLLSAPLFARQAPTARLDVLFTAWITFAAWGWLAAPPDQRAGRLSTGRAAAFWIGLIGALFTKGPLAPIALFGMLLGESWRDRSWQPCRSVRPLPGLLALGALILGWLWTQYAFVGPEAAGGEFAAGTWERLMAGSHVKPVWYYVQPLIGSAFFPWIAFLAATFVTLWRRRDEPLPDGIRPLLFWTAAVLLALHLSPGKRAYYLLPIMPALALITGWFLETEFLTRPLSRRVFMAVTGLAFLIPVALLVSGIVMEINEDRLRLAQFIVGDFQLIIMVILIVLMLGALGVFLRTRTSWSAILTLAVLTLSMEVFYAGVVNTARNQRRSTRSFSSVVNALLAEGEKKVGAVENADKPEYHVYGNYHIQSIEYENGALMAAGTLPRLVVMREDSRAVETLLQTGRYERVFSLAADDDQLVIFQQVAHAMPQTAARTHPPLRFGIAGDSGVGESSDQRNLIAHMVEVHNELPFHAFFLLGDNLYGEDPFEIAMMDRFILPFAPLIKAQVPFYAALGNHDNDHPDRIASELASPFFNMKGREYYQVVFGDHLMTLFVLNSVTLEHDEEQLDWFRQALAESDSRWKVLALHHPMQASKAGHGSEKDLYELLKGLIAGPSGVDLVLAGHNHYFERRTPVDGVTHITLGASGKLEGDDTFQDDPGRAVGYMDGLSFGWLDVDGESLQFTAMSEDGEILDRFQIRNPANEDQRVLARRNPVSYEVFAGIPASSVSPSL